MTLSALWRNVSIRPCKVKCGGISHTRNTYTYIDVLQDLVHSYNNTFHDTLRGRPVDVNRDNADRLFYHCTRVFHQKTSREKKSRRKRFLSRKVRKLEYCEPRKHSTEGMNRTGQKKFSPSKPRLCQRV